MQKTSSHCHTKLLCCTEGVSCKKHTELCNNDLKKCLIKCGTYTKIKSFKLKESRMRNLIWNQLLRKTLHSCSPMCGPDRKGEVVNWLNVWLRLRYYWTNHFPTFNTFAFWIIKYITLKVTCSRKVQVHISTWGKGSAEASSTFSGFRSQWTMFLKCRCLRATRICP